MSDLWVPGSAQELEAAVEAGTVIETHFQEYKQFGQSEAGKPRVPSSLAKSLAGLAVDGGVLVLGVAERKAEQRFEISPQPLLGLRDAVDQVALQALSPSLRVTARELPREDGSGYLVVIVPPSPRAPHMVDGRYYGRGDSSSRPLADIEVRSLWERHLDRRDRIADLLAQEVEREPVSKEDRTNARLFVVAQPVSADSRLLLDAVEDRDLLHWVQHLNDTRLYKRRRDYAPYFASGGTSQRRAHGVARTTPYLESDRTVAVEEGHRPLHSSIVDMEYREDGGLRLYYGRASDVQESRQQRWLLLAAIAGETASIVEAARLVSNEAEFYGSWRFGVALRGIRGITAFSQDIRFDGWRFSEDGYDEVAEVDHTTLHDPGSPVLEALVGRLVRSTKGSTTSVSDLDPFAISP